MPIRGDRYNLILNNKMIPCIEYNENIVHTGITVVTISFYPEEIERTYHKREKKSIEVIRISTEERQA